MIITKVTGILDNTLDKHNLSYAELKQGPVDMRHVNVYKELKKHIFTNNFMLISYGILSRARLLTIDHYIKRNKLF